MYCSDCGTKIENEVEKCPNCGAEILKQTPQPQKIEKNTSQKKNKKRLILIGGGIVAVFLIVILLLPSITYMCTSGEQYYQMAKTTEDQEKSEEYLECAVKKGFPEAMFAYGIRNIKEEYPREKQIEGVEWIRKSAEAGYPPAQGVYGITLIYGSIIPKNVSEGYKWLEISANNGVGESQKQLGIAYFQGNVGVPFDLEKAKYWLGRAAEQNTDGAADMLDYINYLTSPSRHRYNISAEMLKGNVMDLGRMALRNELGY